ncbi:DUF2513 domain-containing protein [Merdimmobilis hominis]|uniref:DUF2513 domain-containing protein n=1 Tax=Merdimmobilis hominis TaxID=2897707 RepID=UPI0008F858E7|nr:DUF2513 domain-containing protein [Merdimmobilis hominis]
MKLDYNCVRDVMLYLESVPYIITNEKDNVEFTGVWLPNIREALPNYPQEVIYYTLEKLQEGGYLNMTAKWSGDGLYICRVNYITFIGHEFLEKIRSDTVWDKTVSIAGKVGNFGLQMLSKIAEGITTAYINNLLSN